MDEWGVGIPSWGLYGDPHIGSDGGEGVSNRWGSHTVSLSAEPSRHLGLKIAPWLLYLGCLFIYFFIFGFGPHRLCSGIITGDQGSSQGSSGVGGQQHARRVSYLLSGPLPGVLMDSGCPRLNLSLGIREGCKKEMAASGPRGLDIEASVELLKPTKRHQKVQN